MRVVALVAAYNEERFIDACLEHLIRQGTEVYLIDNSSSDRTVEIAEQHLRRGLIGIEVAPRDGVYRWRSLLARKEELAAELDADWFMHVDADEFRLPPSTRTTLAGALAEVDRAGYNAVNFLEYCFVPTRESPDHDHPDFQRSMRRYYPFLPSGSPHRLNAWKRQLVQVDLAGSSGHSVGFPGLRICPQPFAMRHYLFLSVAHATRKWVEREYDPGELSVGWHRARAALRREQILLLAESELRRYECDDLLDASNPLRRHPVFAGNATGADRGRGA